MEIFSHLFMPLIIVQLILKGNGEALLINVKPVLKVFLE